MTVLLCGRRRSSVDDPSRESLGDAMKWTCTLPIALLRLVLACGLALVSVTAISGHAQAQLVAAIVNGDPVTNFDIEQRTKLISTSTHKAPSRKEVLDELIDEKLKIQLLRRYNIEGIDKDVDNAFANMARRMHTTTQGFTGELVKQGIQPDTIKSRIKAEMVWGQIIRGRYQSSFQFSDKDIQARIAMKKPDAPLVGYDYTLRPILFVVPRGSDQAYVEGRRKEAEALRSRFESCERDISVAQAMRFVAVRPPVHKSSAELPSALRDILEKTEIGKLTAPESTAQGIQVYALCGRKQSDADNAPAKREVRDELFKEQFESHSKRFLKELRSQAMIEYR
jgi:peptidyl-prolyl cis-trans isomerase SurA